MKNTSHSFPLFFPLLFSSCAIVRVQDLVSMDEAADELGPTDKWARPVAPLLDTRKQGLAFQQMELDSYIDKPMPGMPGPNSLPLPTWPPCRHPRSVVTASLRGDDCAGRRTPTVFPPSHYTLSRPFSCRPSQQPSADYADVRHHYGGPQRPVSGIVGSIYTGRLPPAGSSSLTRPTASSLHLTAPMSMGLRRTSTAQRRRGLLRIM